MKKSTLIGLIIAAALIVLGAGLFCGAMSAVGWDFTALSADEFVTNTIEITKPFVGIEIESDTADIRFSVSEDGSKYVECGDIEGIEYRVEVDNGILKIHAVDTRAWYEYISIGIHPSSFVTVYLPAGEYGSLAIRESTGDVEIPEDFVFFEMDIALSTGDVSIASDVRNAAKITTDTGDITLQNASVGALELKVTSGTVTVSDVVCAGEMSVRLNTGKTFLRDLSCAGLITTGGTGKANMKNVTASGAIEIKRSTGDVIFDACDAASIKVTTDTGDVKGTLRSDKVFVYKTSTGDVDLPKTTTGGTCDITTDTGDIIITIVSK